jgi:hypothetical protein
MAAVFLNKQPELRQKEYLWDEGTGPEYYILCIFLLPGESV